MLWFIHQTYGCTKKISILYRQNAARAWPKRAALIPWIFGALVLQFGAKNICHVLMDIGCRGLLRWGQVESWWPTKPRKGRFGRYEKLVGFKKSWPKITWGLESFIKFMALRYKVVLYILSNFTGVFWQQNGVLHDYMDWSFSEALILCGERDGWKFF